MTSSPTLFQPLASEAISPESASLAPKLCRSCPHAPLVFSETLSRERDLSLTDQEEFQRLKEKIVDLEGKVQRLTQDLFGKKSERGLLAPPSDVLPAQEASASLQETPPPPSPGEIREMMALEEPDPTKRKRGQQPGKKSSGRTRHPDLPRKVEILTPDHTRCSSCQAPFTLFGSPEETEVIEIEVRPYTRLIRRPHYRKTCSCPGTPKSVTAPPVPRLVPRGKIGISLWSLILTDKFRTNRPTFRLLADLKERGLDLAQGTVTDGLKKITPLFAPLYEAVVAKSRTASLSQADETRFPVYSDEADSTSGASKTPHRWWLWVILTMETVVYVLDPSRSAKVPMAHFAQSVGTLVVDRYSAYKYAAARIVGLVLAFCWAHARRDFVRAFVSDRRTKPWAHAWLGRIRLLYRLAKDPVARIKNRDRIVLHLAHMKEVAETDVLSPTLPAPCKKAVKSLINHWDGLTYFLDHPEVPLDNNASERTFRHAVQGRKNFRGAGSLWSADLFVFLSSLFATWSLHGLNIHTTLTDYLTVCANLGSAPKDLSPWLPWTMEKERKDFLSRPLPPDSS